MCVSVPFHDGSVIVLCGVRVHGVHVLLHEDMF